MRVEEAVRQHRNEYMRKYYAKNKERINERRRRIREKKLK